MYAVCSCTKVPLVLSGVRILGMCGVLYVLALAERIWPIMEHSMKLKNSRLAQTSARTREQQETSGNPQETTRNQQETRRIPQETRGSPQETRRNPQETRGTHKEHKYIHNQHTMDIQELNPTNSSQRIYAMSKAFLQGNKLILTRYMGRTTGRPHGVI